MTTSSAVHSQAFGFNSYQQGGVDPRTGQYTVAINLPEVKSNWLGGPAFPVSLGFNPINTQDSGYGMGWNLNLSQFTPHNGMLALHTGETYKVSGNGATPAIKEKKLDSFHFENLGSDRYRVVHKSGLVEVLQVGGSSNDRVALPVEIYSPSGHRITLTHVSFRGGQRLQSISDVQGELLRINRIGDARVEILARPNDGPGGGPLARYEMHLNASGWVTSIVLPTADKASWRFGYGNGPIRGILCLHEVKTPSGGRETIEYTDTGHPYPGGVTRPNLPRVTRHSSHPGFGQPTIQVDYSYTAKNFLGAGATVSWEDGMDPLYKVATSYEYGSTAKLMNATRVLREVDRTFSRFHSLSEEKITQDHCVQRVKTEYYATDVSFEQQVAQFQLPKRTSTRWEMDNDATRFREEEVLSVFNEHGNQTEEVDTSGIKTLHTYYPAQTDTEGFERNVKDSTQIPSPSGQSPAPTLRTHFSYRKLVPLADSGLNQWLALETETQVQVVGDSEDELQQTQHSYYDLPDDAFLHGRAQAQQTTVNGKTSTATYEYERLNSVLAGETILQTTETFKGFDDVPGLNEVRKITISEDSLLHGKPLLTRDDNKVKIRYTYDSLIRVLSETVAPDEVEFEATRWYEYFLTSQDGQQASQVVIDVKGVKTRSLVDGLSRPVYEERQDADNPLRAAQYRQTWSARYDMLENQVEETQFDWRGAQQVTQTSTLEYDAWGMQRSVTGPDGVKVIEETDPIGTSEWKGPIQTRWREGVDKVSGKVVTYLNLFEKPARIERFETDQTFVSKHQYEYDGLGRTIKETDARDATTQYVYDAFNRLINNILPGGATVNRRYAEHSTEDSQTEISVDGIVLGRQVFNGLNLMSESVTGGRKQLFTYEPGQTRPASVITPSNQKIIYSYQPQLGEEPSARRLPDKEPAEYVRDGKNARLVSCKEDGLELQRQYFSTGELKSESRVQGDRTDTMHYDYSRQGLLLSYTDVLQQVQTYTYDTAGRLEHTRLGTTSSSFTFDSLGQSSTINTQDSASGQQVTITLEHDGLGRETKRTFDLDGVEQDLTQVYNEVDLLVRRTLRTGGTLLRDETYDYDPRGRLVLYQCQGSQPPVDPYGKAIVSQLFRFDVIDNLIRVTTTYRSTGDTNSTNIAVYSYTGVDPAQLTKVTNSASGDGYPAVIELAYNADGHMTRDEENRVLEYDTLGRLIHVSASPGGESGTYNYDPLDTLSGLDDGDGAERRFYRDGELANQIKGANSSTFMRGDGVVLVEHQAGADPKSLMLVSDASSSLISEVANGGVNSINYTAYGHRTGEHPVNSQVGYNGEVKELKTNCYMLGNGYRQFSPSLKVFFSPDSLSPFGVGGINAYAYCEGDPINNVDETGHMPRRVSFVPAQAAPLRPIDARFEAIAENLKFNRRAEVSPSQAARSRLTRDIALLTPGTAESAVRVRRRAPSPAPQEPPPDYDSDTGPAAVKSISSRRAKSDPVVPGASSSTVEARPAKSGGQSSARTHVPKPRELTEKEREKALSARIEEIRALHGKRL